MKKAPMAAEAISIETEVWKRVLCWEDEPILHLSLQFPKLPDTPPGLRRIGRYYHQIAEQWKRRWEGRLYAQAQAAARSAREASHLFRSWEARLTYSVTYQQDGLLSLYLDAYEYTGGAHGLTVRHGDTWQVPEGTPRALHTFFPPHSRWRRQIFSEICRQIESRVKAGDSLFADDWEHRLAPAFDPEHFYLTSEGISVFFPLYSIAPYAEGIPAFPIPFPGDHPAPA
ncbi:DUF3298 and DUF4163 domain-containing protein [Lawsonibacter celer]|jgi:hypothetical protein|uniref:DUF3298 and DUF4163 domain-containing protein n=1 Tax=Lawsonibacter celer TaxID=2986526 RepID=UPI0016445A10|nr:DUF3298 and DUF4163 domain-containing protein [Lawsonibacter celer]